MNKESNSYTLIYASVMVILVALALAFTSEALRPQQAKNEAIDKMSRILASLNIISNRTNVESEYRSVVVKAYLINKEGNQVEGNAFDVELADELYKPVEERRYPVFEALINGDKKYVLSLRGTGLWGPIWGYISLNNDKNTVYGASFGHEGETPGLGGEIDKPAFATEFSGKKIFNNTGKFTSIAIVKPGKTAQGQDYVDGISGGTITSRGVDAMLFSSLEFYVPFLTELH
ncbi:MAG: NADH:ubiquinone reductase (Na(+)-transporting) subunit C [Dysgonamonadaceae bacterium]|jgi:Na+-transporting NADH:ubiquinone oxidoreductase subunit C|nr:NADH:ubiquinone reductase (Na(+)-transporting) subunit C [Dysgonamonadaceae bacterium]